MRWRRGRMRSVSLPDQLVVADAGREHVMVLESDADLPGKDLRHAAEARTWRH